MLIVLDTTEFFDDLRMERANFTLLKSYVHRHPVKLIILQIVIEEMVNHFRESLASSLERVNIAIRSVKRFVPGASLNIDEELSIETECTNYREYLKNQLVPAQQIGYEDVNVSSLVRRSLARRKPFDSKGKAGFRDAIIWEQILQLAETKPDEILLITLNKKDFGGHGQLHKDLSADLVANGLSNVKVTICEGLGRFINERVKPSLERLDEIERQIEEDELLGFNATTFFNEYRLDIEDALRDGTSDVDLDSCIEDRVYHYSKPRFRDLASVVNRFDVSNVWRVNEELLGVGIQYYLEGSMKYLQESISGPYDEPDKEEFLGEVEYTLIMTIIIEEDTADVVSWELDEIEVMPIGDWGLSDRDD